MAKILMFVDDAAQDIELFYPYYRLIEEGYDMIMVAEKKDMTFKGKYGISYKSKISYDEVNVSQYAGLLIPGGWAPDKIRSNESALSIVRAFNEQNKPIGQICHAGWVTISANILKGRNVTSVPAIKDDMLNAGAHWYDEAAVVDGNLVSSRCPNDLPEYMKAYIKVLEQSKNY